MTRTIVGFELIINGKKEIHTNRTKADAAIKRANKAAELLNATLEIEGPVFIAKRLVMSDEEFEKMATEVEISAEEMLRLEQDYSVPRTRKPKAE